LPGDLRPWPSLPGRRSVVVFEVASIWRFPDGAEATINACSIFTITDGKFTDQRIYVDNSPINAYLS
jgi:hypothetical protein